MTVTVPQHYTAAQLYQVMQLAKVPDSSDLYFLPRVFGASKMNSRGIHRLVSWLLAHEDHTQDAPDRDMDYREEEPRALPDREIPRCAAPQGVRGLRQGNSDPGDSKEVIGGPYPYVYQRHILTMRRP